VKFLGQQSGHFVFRLARPEKQLLLAILKLYPCIPPAHHRLTTPGARTEDESNQRLLDEALADQRKENRRRIESLVNDPERFADMESGCRMTLSSSDVEWLLQVLNDVRVGNWVMLGSPGHGAIDVEVNQKTAPQIWALEVSGHFQVRLLEALRTGKPT
jgi:hypothetical protein